MAYNAGIPEDVEQTESRKYRLQSNQEVAQLRFPILVP